MLVAENSPGLEVNAEGSAAHPRPSSWTLFRLWLAIGAQSFGGGTATQYLIYQAFVDRRRWLRPDEFAHGFSMCQLTPGINLLALTILLGWRLRGPTGVAVSLAGLLLPSVTITVLMTALYAGVRDHPVVRAALRGIVPATVGLGLLMSWQIARPLLAASRGIGNGSLLVDVLVLTTSGLLLLYFSPPIIALLLAGGTVVGAYGWLRTRTAPGPKTG